jgi:hypothetical protein
MVPTPGWGAKQVHATSGAAGSDRILTFNQLLIESLVYQGRGLGVKLPPARESQQAPEHRYAERAQGRHSGPMRSPCGTDKLLLAGVASLSPIFELTSDNTAI